MVSISIGKTFFFRACMRQCIKIENYAFQKCCWCTRNFTRNVDTSYSTFRGLKLVYVIIYQVFFPHSLALQIPFNLIRRLH